MLPPRKSEGISAEHARTYIARYVSDKLPVARANTVEFFKVRRDDGSMARFAVYGEQGLETKRGRKTLTHIVDIDRRNVVSVPFNFISVWNGSQTDASLILVEPPAAEGAPPAGKILGIPLDELVVDAASTLADPSKWTVVRADN